MEKAKEKLIDDAIRTALDQNKTINIQRGVICVLLGVLAILAAFFIREV